MKDVSKLFIVLALLWFILFSCVNKHAVDDVTLGGDVNDLSIDPVSNTDVYVFQDTVRRVTIQFDSTGVVQVKIDSL